MTTERSRGAYYLQPAQAINLKYRLPLELPPRMEGVGAFADGLQEIISIYENQFNPWVQSIGGKGYSEITAISQYMFLTLLGATGHTELEKFSLTGFPKKAHLVWRIISTLDDIADNSEDQVQVPIRGIVDSEGLSVERMIDEFFQFPGFPILGRWMAEQILSHASKHEKNKHKTFDQAIKAKQKTTGMFTAAGILAAWPYFLKTFPAKTLHASLPKIINQSVAGSLIAQVIDDMVDLPRDLDRSLSSSLVVAALNDSNERDLVRMLHTRVTPISIAVLLNNDSKAGDTLFQFYLDQRKKLSGASQQMLDYFDHQFLFSTTISS